MKFNNVQKERIIFNRDGTFEIYKNSASAASGTYDYNSSSKTITLTVQANGETKKWMLTNVYVQNGSTLTEAIFNGVIYRKCQ